MKTTTQLYMIIVALNITLLATISAYAVEAGSTQTSVSQTSSSNFFSKERWGAGYTNYINGPTFSESDGGSINHYLTLKHKFSPDWALSATLQPDSNFGNESGFMTMGDPYMKLDYPAIYKRENGLNVTGDVRYYAPLSEASSKAKALGAVSTFFKASQDLDRFSFNYVLIPKLYLNTLNEEGQTLASHGHYASTSYKISPTVSLDFAVYPVWKFKRNRATAFNDLPAYPGFTVNFSEGLALSPYVEIPILKAEKKAISAGAQLSYKLF